MIYSHHLTIPSSAVLLLPIDDPLSVTMSTRCNILSLWFSTASTVNPLAATLIKPIRSRRALNPECCTVLLVHRHRPPGYILSSICTALKSYPKLMFYFRHPERIPNDGESNVSWSGSPPCGTTCLSCEEHPCVAAGVGGS